MSVQMRLMDETPLLNRSSRKKVTAQKVSGTEMRQEDKRG